MSDPTRTDRLRLAAQAHERALALAAKGNTAEARRWLERACRLLPHDDTLALALATACLGQHDAKAVALFANLAARHDRREVWAGLAIARRHPVISKALLRRFRTLSPDLVPDATLASVADLFVRHSAAPVFFKYLLFPVIFKFIYLYLRHKCFMNLFNDNFSVQTKSVR